MVKCPTSLLPICPSGVSRQPIPKLQARYADNYSINNQNWRIGFRNRIMFLSSDNPHPSRIHKITFYCSCCLKIKITLNYKFNKHKILFSTVTPPAAGLRFRLGFRKNFVFIERLIIYFVIQRNYLLRDFMPRNFALSPSISSILKADYILQRDQCGKANRF